MEIARFMELIAKCENERAAQERDPTPFTDERLLWLACRFCAAQDVDACLEGMNRREWINLFQDGFPGYKTQRDIERYFETVEELTDADLRKQVREFFFGKRGA